MASIALLKQGLKALEGATGDKPTTAVTDWIERLCGEKYQADDYEFIPELVESVNLQATGPTEASRAIRKKLKYGNVHRQIRALFILKALVENCNERFQNQFADSQLVERIKIMAADPAVDASVKKMLYAVLGSWQRQFKDDPSKRAVANLYNEVKGGGNDRAYQAEQARLRKAEEERSIARRREAEDRASEATIKKILEEDKVAEAKRVRDVQTARRAHLAMQESKIAAEEKQRLKAMKSAPQTYSQVKSRSGAQAQRVPFDIQKEKSNVLLATATCTQACHGLVNALQLVNREKDSVADNAAVQEALGKVKDSRKKVVRYIQLVESDPTGEFIGTLLSTNEQAVAALQLYDRYCKPAEQDSDDEQETGMSTAQLTQAADGNKQAIAETSTATAAAKRPAALVRGVTELDKLQDRQRDEVERLNRARAREKERERHSKDSVHPDLADLSLDSSSSSSYLPQPIQPKHYGDDASLRSEGDDGLSDYSDYSSSDEDDYYYRRSRRNSSSRRRRSSGAYSGSGNRSYAKYLDPDEQKRLGKKGGLLDADEPSSDPFADPFAGDETPGVNDKKRMEWREV